MCRESRDDAPVQTIFCQCLQHLAFGEKTVLQRQFHGLRMPFRQNGRGHARGAAARQHQFLTDRKVRHTRENCLLGKPSDVRRGGWQRQTRTKSKRNRCRTAAMARRLGECGCCASRNRTPSDAIHFPFSVSAKAVSTTAETSARAAKSSACFS